MSITATAWENQQGFATGRVQDAQTAECKTFQMPTRQLCKFQSSFDETFKYMQRTSFMTIVIANRLPCSRSSALGDQCQGCAHSIGYGNRPPGLPVDEDMHEMTIGASLGFAQAKQPDLVAHG